MGLRQTKTRCAPGPAGTHGKGTKINLQCGPGDGGGEDGCVVSDVAGFVDDEPGVVEDMVAVIVLGRAGWRGQEQQD